MTHLRAYLSDANQPIQSPSPNPSFMGFSHSGLLSPALITSLLGTLPQSLLEWLKHASPNLLTLPDSPSCENHSVVSHPPLPPLPPPNAGASPSGPPPHAVAPA